MHSVPRMFLSIAAALLLAGFTMGCGAGGLNSPTGTVSGKVTIDGKPLSNATIIFMGESNGETGSAPLQTDGSYTLKCGSGFSVPVGDYRIAISATAPNAPAPDPMDLNKNPEKYKPNSTIPEKYRDAKTSQLIAVVKSGSNSNTDFNLKP